MNYLYESTFRKGRAKNYNNLNLLIVLICLHLLLTSIASLKCGKVCNLAPPFLKVDYSLLKKPNSAGISVICVE